MVYDETVVVSVEVRLIKLLYSARASLVDGKSHSVTNKEMIDETIS